MHLRRSGPIVAVGHVATVLCLLSWSTGAAAQQQQGTANQLQPLEHIVGDQGPGRVSLRRVQPGLSITNAQESRVYQRAGADPNASINDNERLIYIDQGITASFDRSQYIQDREGNILQKIPPNTVFHLGIPDRGPDMVEQAANTVRPGEIDGRVDGRIDAPRRDRRVPVRVERSQERGDGERSIVAERRRRQYAVLVALDRLIESQREREDAGADEPIADRSEERSEAADAAREATR